MSKNGHGRIQIAGGGPAWDEELRLWLEDHIKKYPHLTPAVLAQAYGVEAVIVPGSAGPLIELVGRIGG